MKTPRDRLYVDEPLSAGAALELYAHHYNYLVRVLRMRIGSELRIFNEQYGEWRAEIVDVGKRTVTVRICECVRQYAKSASGLTLIVAPIKNPGIGFCVQKATELGVCEIVPIITAYSVVREVNIDKLRGIAVEATEQSERLDVPSIHNPIMLSGIGKMDYSTIFWCDEKEGERYLIDVLRAHVYKNDAILIGPEGGFSEEERSFLAELPNVVPISLGSSILRAETAVIAALAVYNAIGGMHERG